MPLRGVVSASLPSSCIRGGCAPTWEKRRCPCRCRRAYTAWQVIARITSAEHCRFWTREGREHPWYRRQRPNGILLVFVRLGAYQTCWRPSGRKWANLFRADFLDAYGPVFARLTVRAFFQNFSDAAFIFKLSIGEDITFLQRGTRGFPISLFRRSFG
jgi:hypothetical protein